MSLSTAFRWPTAAPLAVLLGALVLPVAAPAASPAKTPEVRPHTHTEHLSNQVDIEVTSFPARQPARASDTGRFLLLWIAPSFGFNGEQARMAERLAADGVEVWQADVAEALFLPRGSPSMRKLDGRYVADLVERAHTATGKRIVLVSSSYGAIPVLRGARVWQSRAPKTPMLAGAILFSPNAYATVPSLGLPPQYVPIVRSTNIPIAIFQGGINGNRWQLPQLIDALRSGGATVYTEIMPGITGLFFHHEEHHEALAREFSRAPRRIERVLPLLAAAPVPLEARPLAGASKQLGRGLDAELKPFHGDPHPQTLRLHDAKGHLHVIDHYRGRVTVVNFWASWCSPCVKEIPSLNRLRKAMRGEPFKLVSVNYAEGAKAIRDFLDKVDVDYPVLIDRDGKEAAKWNVVVFPSTFVIGPDGLIHYGVNAGLEWDQPQVIATLRRLAKNQGRGARATD
ncbi:MAG TPA: TlpA disulfide reductase family protein [Gammaproteobacteria bacterium]|nr:TlpA disulfide reductase family protein [Gammaproteobacteria bacterium]